MHTRKAFPIGKQQVQRPRGSRKLDLFKDSKEVTVAEAHGARQRGLN
jgi:hypothetical protein